jgi:RHS repeat-associated protein
MRADIQTLVNAQAAQWETRITTGNGYTTNTWPATLATTLTINYYDAYNDIPGLPAAYSQQNNPKYTKMLTGMSTASKTNVLGSADMLWTVPYYDNEGRTVSTYKQHYLGGASSYSVYNYDIDSTLYNFNDQPTRLIHRHYAKNAAGTAAALQVTGIDFYSYDHMGRKRRVQHQIRHSTASSQAVIILSNMDYNEIGQLKIKKLHSINSGSNYLQGVDYRYNPRGWLSSINNAGLTNDGGITNSDTNDQFGMELSYDNSAKPQYNGNIGTIKWKSGPVSGVAQPQYAYDYGYDRINRMTDAVSVTAGVKNANYGEYLKYDVMGNITSLGRWDVVSSTRTQIDSLTYTYLGNRHTRVDDAAAYTGPAGFTDGVQVDNEYTYDGNGNALTDLNKGISNISYNLLNLPQTITINGNTLTYTYDAAGNKLRKVFTAGAVTTTDYISGVQYSNGAIEFMQTEEGRARKNGSSYLYEYDLDDHLGNTRVTIKPDTADATQLTPLVLQQNNYYPFGAAIRSLETVVANPKNEYLYNGKELQEETGLYDYGARFYNPLIGRWGSVDPLAEKGRRWSPYAYGFDNSMRFIDPDGMWPDGPDDPDNDASVQKGFWRPPTSVEKEVNPIGAFFRKQSYDLASSLGLNDVDDAISDIQNSDQPATTGDKVDLGLKTAISAFYIMTSFGEGEGKPRTVAPYKSFRVENIKDGHHIVQDAAVRDLPGYQRGEAPAINLDGPSNVRGTEHNIATQTQIARRKIGDGGTYKSERNIAYRTLRGAGLTPEQAKQAVRAADNYFLDLGVDANTSTRIPYKRD